MLKRVMSRFFVEFFLSRSTRKICRGTLLYCVLEKFPVANKFMDKKGGSVEICR